MSFLRFAAVAAFLLFFGFPTSVTAQTVVGDVIAASDETALPGVAVRVAGTDRGTTTASDGRFTLGLPAYGNYELIISYLGFRSQTVSVSVSPDRPTVSIGIALETRVFTTEELIVSATRAEAETPVTYVNLDAAEIAENNLGQDMPYVLKWTPSVVVASDAGAGIGYTGIWIRGSDPSRTNVTINGIPLNDSESQGVFWVNLPDFASSADEIQIQRGVGTSTNGAGAFGASININTNQLREDAYGSVDGGIGSYGTRRGNVRFGTGRLANGISVDGRLSRTLSDGYIDRASVDLTGYSLGLGYTGDKSVLRVNLFGGREVTYQAWNGVDASLVDDPVTRRSNTAGTEKAGEPYDNEVDDYGQDHLQLHYSTQLGRSLALKLSGHYTRGAGFFEQYKAGETLADYGITAVTPGGETIAESDLIRRRWLDNDFHGLIYALEYRSGDERTRATLGGGYNHYDGRHFGEVIWARYAGDAEIRENYYDNDGIKRDFNVYGKVQRGLTDALSAYVDLQIRRVDYDFLGLDNNLNRVDQSAGHTFFNPKAGLFYQLSPKTEAYASFGVAQREPNRNDFVDNPLTTRPRPEKLLNTEIGYRTVGRRANLGLNLYHMYYRDQLVLNGQLNDVGEYIRVNVPDSYRLGLEVQAGYAFSERFNGGLTATFSRNRVSNYREFLDDYDEDFGYLGQVVVDREDTPLAFSPSVLAGGELSYAVLQSSKVELEAAILGKYVGRRYLDNSGDDTNVIDPYFYGDFRLSASLGQTGAAKRLRFMLQVNNVFDTFYAANGWSYRYQLAGEPQLLRGLYPQATRNYLLGLGVDF